MCGRFYVDEATEKSIRDLTGDQEIVVKKGDIHPSEQSIILDFKKDALIAKNLFWGFAGYQKNQLLINARAETITKRPAFKESVLKRRCVIPAKGFYEWNPDKEKFQFEDEKGTLYLAGCYDDLGKFVIITTAANASVLPVHPRMPLLISKEEIPEWITDEDFMAFALQRVPEELKRLGSYQQMSLFDP